MSHLLFVLLYLAHLVQGTSAASTSSSCPPPNSNESTRSVWSILGSCGLTLLICVWHALHPDVPKPGQKWYKALSKRVGFVLLSFFAPEVVVGRASEEWCSAHRHVREFREQGYEWSMTHSHFALMRGFVYHDDKVSSSPPIYPHEFLERCKEGKIANPLVTEKQIKDKSKTDVLGKIIFVVQLSWFTLQVVIRSSMGLATTLIELDTVCMAALALVYLVFWWDKPLLPDCPHIFYSSGEKKVYLRTKLSKAWRAGPGDLHELIAYIRKALRLSIAEVEQRSSPKPGKLTAMIEKLNADNVESRSILITWFILGALHLIAWNFEYPTEAEKITWRVAALVLAGSPLTLFVLLAILESVGPGRYTRITVDCSILCVWILGVVSRALLVALMLASLRALPCSARLTITWTAYIPHL